MKAMQVWVWGRAAAAIEAKLQARLFRCSLQTHLTLHPLLCISTAQRSPLTSHSLPTAPSPARSTLTLDMASLDQCRTSDVLQRLTSDVQEVSRALEARRAASHASHACSCSCRASALRRRRVRGDLARPSFRR